MAVNFEVPEYTADVDGIGTLRFLDNDENIKKINKILSSFSSELYGKVKENPERKNTIFIQDLLMQLLNYILIGL